MSDYWVNKYKISDPDALKYLKANGAVVDENGNVLSEATDYWKKVYREAEPKVAKYLHEDGTIDENSGSGGGSYDDTELRNRITQIEDDVGDLADLKTADKTSLVNAINSILPKVQSRPIVTIVTTKSSASATSELTGADLATAKAGNLIGSYLVTVHRETSNSLGYFIGWIDMSTFGLADASFTKITGGDTMLYPDGDTLVYAGGDSSDITKWVFQPIGDNYTDN
jgi:hypothetical protein